MKRAVIAFLVLTILCCTLAMAQESYTNFEASQVHPITMTPSQDRLLVVNTPSATLEVYSIDGSGDLSLTDKIPVGLEPVSVAARSDNEAWVVNHLSDSISIVDLSLGMVTDTLKTSDEPYDVVFANGRAFVAVSQEDQVEVFDLSDLSAAPTVIEIFSVDPRALAVSGDGSQVYVVAEKSGNQTTVMNANVMIDNPEPFRAETYPEVGKNPQLCISEPGAYPPLPPGMTRNPAAPDVGADQTPFVGLIVKWNELTGAWEDETGKSWNHCLPVALPDQDLFVIDTTTLTVTQTISGLGTTLFEVSVNPATGEVWVPNTDARNEVRFEHPIGVQGHIVENQMSIVDLSTPSTSIVNLNTHIDRNSDPDSNLAERLASVSQPGMMTWEADGSHAYLSVIGSRKIFRVDGACRSGGCIFGTDRANPDVIEIGEGPTGVALNESNNRLYALLRFSNEIAVADTSTLSVLSTIQMDDPSSETVKNGRRILYDGIDSSAHGDSSCATCHVSGDNDGLGWDLSNPEGAWVTYAEPLDNVRFVRDGPKGPIDCDPAVESRCAILDGFEPHKGPMTTQTFRGMIEPLHWRGDRPTFSSFNGAFVALMGLNSQIPTETMELFRQFTLGITYPPNPYRNVDDSEPDALLSWPDRGFSGNPVAGRFLFENVALRGPRTCRACHAAPFGSAGAQLGGVEPSDPTSPGASALFNGNRADFDTPAFDVEVGHLRNMYEKQGATFGDHVSPAPDSKSGFGFMHDGSIPDFGSMMSQEHIDGWDFINDPNGPYDVAAFLMLYNTGTKPGVGQNVTVPAGAAPTGTGDEEALINTLLTIGDIADADRHCELTASTFNDGRVRRYSFSGGSWKTDVQGEAQVSTADLRANAGGPITFLCGTLGSGPRLGGDPAFTPGACVIDDNCVDADPCTVDVCNAGQCENNPSPDSDSDGFCDLTDNCPSDANADQADADADSVGDACDTCTDVDGDGFGNPGFPANTCGEDNCPADFNPDQADSDGDGAGDVCDDCANDNDCDDGNACTTDTCTGSGCVNTPLPDTDNDGFCDLLDNCPSDSNADQANADGDTTGDVCDTCTDTDGDGFGNPGFPANTCPEDNCPNTMNADQLDSDFDGIGDVCDNDDNDFDGMGDNDDPCPLDARNLCFGDVVTDGNTGLPIRINTNTSSAECAGQRLDCNGDTWFAEFGSNQGRNATCDLANGCPISNIDTLFGCSPDEATEDIFQCARWDRPAAPELIFSYDVPDGEYVVNMLFSENRNATAAVGARVFDISIEGQIVYDDFDTFEAAGAAGSAVIRSARVNVTDGNGIQIELIHQVENPSIMGLEIIAPSCEFNSDCDDGNPCTDDSCNAGACINSNNTNTCDDGVACTSGDVCGGGTCSGTDNCGVNEECNVNTGVCDFNGCLTDAECADSDPCTEDVCNGVGTCENNPLPDGDSDGLCDATDNCPSDANADQADADADATGDVCDTCTDTDGDGFGDPGFPANVCAEDNCPNVSNADQTDTDGDGVGDACETGPANDGDFDGILDGSDPCPTDPRNLCFGPVAIDNTTTDPVRMNLNTSGNSCAGDKIDCNGDLWVREFGSNQGRNAVCNLPGGCPISGIDTILGCTDDATEDLFQCSRWDRPAAPELIYSYDIPNGSYVVNIYLAETFTGTSNPGERVFDIEIEGNLVHDDVDAVALTGGAGIALVRSAVVTVSDGNGMTIEFLHTGANNPAVKAIEVLSQN